MLQPVNLQLAHYNVEHTAQISKGAIAAAQQTGQSQEITQESVRRAQVVQNTEASEELQKIKRRSEDERGRRQEQQQAFSDILDTSDSEREDKQEQGLGQKMEQKTVLETKFEHKSVKAFDLYA